ncbi:MAG: DNA mismatch repair protein MutS, partial [Deltaproteobacteria bacterium]
ARQAAVASLVEAGAARSEVRAALAPAADLERLLARLSLGQGNARDLRALARTLTVAPAVAAALAKAAGEAGGLPERLEALSAALHGFEALATKLDGALVDEPPATVREGGLFRPGYDPRLDEVLALSTDGKRTLLELEQRERARTGIPSLKIRFNKIFGYYIEVTHAHREKVPPEYERRQTMKGSERYVTPELKAWEEKVLGAEERRKALEYELFEALRQEVVAEASRLRRLAAALAEIDVLAALAHTAAQRGWCRPVLDESRELQIEAGRHPVVEAALEASGGEPFVPNDVRLDEDAFLMILTGPNMAGKSTVMRQVALIALLAHVGSYVPARSCRLGLCDRIFTRVGASDDLARGQSTFMVEMTETARILNHATDRSLVILDEIGRGTSTWDGVSIAWAVAEHIHDHLRCRTLFATHYHELTDLAKERSGVVNYTVAVREWEGQIVFLRRLVPGAANRSYGIQVARLAGLPRAVLDRAAEVLANLEAGELDEVGRPALAHHRGEPPGKGQLTLFSVPRRESEAERLIAETDPDGLSPREALDLLYRLKALL